MFEFLRRRWHRLGWRPPRERPASRPVSLRENDPLVARVLATRPVIDRILRENIIPYWYPRCLDRSSGGYYMHRTAPGAPRGPADKYAMTQTRMCWFLARLAGLGILPEAMEAAELGGRFLRDAFWDPTHGGLFWSVTSDGHQVRDDRKLLMAQTCALYAVAELARAGRGRDAAAFAGEIFDLIERRYRDRTHGGYHQRYSRSWESNLGAAGKTLNDQLHVLEPYALLARVSDEPLVRERLHELMIVATSTMVRQTAGACTDYHREDWSPVLDREHAIASYGHDLELVWLTLDACGALGYAPSLVTEWGLTLMESASRWGWDRRHGGWFEAGPLGGPAWSRRKVCWVQAEALVATLALYRRTGDPVAAELYLGTLDWVTSRQVDWAAGEWHMVIEPSGRVIGDAAGEWKSPYHNGRAMLLCLELLEPAAELPPAPGEA